MVRLTGLLALGLLLGACAPSSSSTTSAGAGFPVTLEHKYGSTTIEKAPVRVVTVGLVDQDAFVALGVVPVGTREWYGNVPGALFPWAKAKAGEAPLPEVLTYELDFEKIASLNPDVIVGLYSGLTQEEYDTLSKIAPTVAQPAGAPDWSADWRTITRTAGSILGKSAEADALVAGLEARYVQAKKDHPEITSRTAVLLSDYGWPETFFAYSYHGGALRFLTDVGFQPLKEVVDLTGETTGIPLSRERFRVVDADLVLWNVSGPQGQAAVEADPAWKGLNAPAEGRVIFYQVGTGSEYDALVFASVLSLDWAFDKLLASHLAASDGDPETN